MWPNWYLGALHEADDEYCADSGEGERFSEGKPNGVPG
jgi:hypothetical protein